MGGVTTYSGITYRRHGLPTYIISNLAAQDLIFLDKLRAEKIQVLPQKADRTTHFVNYIAGNTRYQELPQQAGPIKAGQIHAIFDGIDGLHLGPLHPLDIDPAAVRRLRDSELSIFLDVQGYTRKIKNQKIYPSVSEHTAAGLAVAQVIKANEFEYQAILDFFDMNLTDLMIRFKIQETVVTLGQKGGFVRTQTGESHNYAACTVNVPIDHTGAGDVFFAAYILSRFTNQMQIRDACRYAARIAARQIEGKYITIDRLGLD